MFGVIVSALAVLASAALAQWIHFMLTKPKNVPPGPFPLPLLGSLWVFIGRDTFQVLDYLKKHYRDCCTFYAGSSASGLFIFIYDYDLVMEMSSNNEIAEQNADRPLDVARLREVKEGIIWAQYNEAGVRRRFLAKSLKDLGLGVSSASRSSPHIEDEVSNLLAKFEENTGKPFDPNFPITEAMASIILLSTMSQRLDLTNKYCRTIYKGGLMYFDGSLLELILLPYIHILRHLVADKMAEGEREMEVQMDQWMKEEARARIDSGSYLNPRDVLDFHLATKKELDDGFIRSMVDSFLAAMDTTQAVVKWNLYYLSHLPDEQDRLFKEMEQVVPLTRYPTGEDLNKLPRMHAFLEEAMRYCRLCPHGFPRRCNAPLQFGKNKEYMVKANTHLLFAFSLFNIDEEYWHDPQSFRVDRFLDADGNFQPQSHYTIFGNGKRICPGEHIARLMLFITTASIVQRFKWRLAEHVPFNARRLHSSIE